MIFRLILGPSAGFRSRAVVVVGSTRNYSVRSGSLRPDRAPAAKRKEDLSGWGQKECPVLPNSSARMIDRLGNLYTNGSRWTDGGVVCMRPLMAVVVVVLVLTCNSTF